DRRLRALGTDAARPRAADELADRRHAGRMSLASFNFRALPRRARPAATQRSRQAEVCRVAQGGLHAEKLTPISMLTARASPCCCRKRDNVSSKGDVS